ncbi:DUF1648 domain-containing protein [Clostridium tyrobutyricum]|uniref:DUF1648 domain-containing protein n=2 Tax=Clostridium tyrobutyricum TaxID=1519 RepID=UPI0010A9B29A|nr:DUF1648 domain-containing protein [Clostridium tyrobutyricum]MBR9649472.1 DUF1648 domain-containing protein [Clostridium tyrobutyricum]QCH27019.1 hypothetical protein EZN00_00608 [Clostridium tyrobutyricum]
MEKRPKIKIQYSIYEIIIELISIIAIFINVYLLLKYYKVLPNVIPTHFSGTSVPDGYGSKNAILILAGINFIMYIFLTILSRFPRLYNYIKPITKENAEYQYKCARQLIIIIKAEFAAIFTYIGWNSIRIALEKVSGLGMGFLPVILVAILGTLAIYIRKCLK